MLVIILQPMAKDNIKGFRPETLAVAFGYDPEMGMGSVKPPIFMTSTFVYPSAQHAKNVHEAYFDGTGPLVGETNHIYSRLGHPGLDFLEKRLAAIDGAEEAVAYSSGMAAHSSIALAYVRPGDSVLHGRPIYGGVDMLYNSIMPQFGSHVAAYTDGTDENDVRKAADEAMAKVKKDAQRSCPEIGDSYFAKVEIATDYRMSLAFSLDVMKLGQGQAKLRILTQDELSK